MTNPSTINNAADLARYIDHTLLKPAASNAQIEQLCQEALQYNFAAVCINPCHISRAAKILAGSSVKVCTVIGFPLGANITAVKRYEAQEALKDGALELDMVMNIGALKSGETALVQQDIATVTEAAHQGGGICKVIIETVLLTDKEKIQACQLALQAGADFVKTSTGFSGGGATIDDVALMRKTVGPNLGVKAAGGIKTLQDALAMITAGATRIGASAGVTIIQDM